MINVSNIAVIAFNILRKAFILVSLLAITNITAAQSIDDFKKAVKEEGCESIPYSSLRDRCKDKQEDVEDYCKIKKLKCDNIDPEGLNKNIENMKIKSSDLKKEKEDLEEKMSKLTDEKEKQDIRRRMEEVADKIKKLEDKIAQDSSKVYDEYNRIRERISYGDKCLDYRIAVWEVFKNAKSKARSESNPETKPFEEQLVQKWEKKEKGHEAAIYNFKEAIDKCKNML